MRCVRRWIVAALLFGWAGGCSLPSQVMWSPDGHRGMFAASVSKGGGAVVIDESGHILMSLGSATGGACWSADSKTAYFGSISDGGGIAPAPVSRQWVANDASDEPPDPPSDHKVGVICRWRDGHVDPLVSLGNVVIGDVHLSADEKWLAVSTVPDSVLSSGPGAALSGAGLFAYALETGRLYRVSTGAGPACFVGGPARLAFVESSTDGTGRVVQMALDAAAQQPDHQGLAQVLPALTPALRPAAGDRLLMQTTAAQFPAPATACAQAGLYSINGDDIIVRLAASVGPVLAVSPDGRRVLLVQSSDGTGRHGGLALMDVDGSHRRAVLELPDELLMPPMLPAWHGNDRVTFISTHGRQLPAQGNRQPRTVYDVIDYDVPADGPLRPARTLSQDWPDDLLPSAATPSVRTTMAGTAKSMQKALDALQK